MKSIKKVIAIAMILFVIFSSFTMVEATSKGSVTIQDPVINGNKVTFEILFKDGAVLIGDIDSNGYVNMDDASRLSQAILGGATLTDEEMLAADIALRGNGVEAGDSLQLSKCYNGLGFQLTGSFAYTSDLEISREEITNGTKYIATVTIPEREGRGTIGIKLNSKVYDISADNFVDIGAVGYADNTFNTKEIVKEIGFGDGISEVYVPENVPEFDINVSEGIKKDNKVTFNIKLPAGVGLRGDVDGNGLVYDTAIIRQESAQGDLFDSMENVDSEIIYRYLDGVITQNDINVGFADYNLNKTVERQDGVNIKQAHVQTKNLVELTGSLAENSIYEFVKNDDGSYSVIATIPANFTEGTIGVKVTKGIFMNANSEVNKEAVSEELDLKVLNSEFKVVDEKQEATTDGKVKVTVTVNEELNEDRLPEGWELSEDGKSISKVMNEGETENLKLVSKYNKEIDYTVKVKELESDSQTDTEFKVVDEKQEATEDRKTKVTITVNKELDEDKLPEGWELSEDGKSISKVMNVGDKEDLTLVSKDGDKLKYTVTAKDKTQANTSHPQTGVTNVILIVIAGIAIVGTVLFIRSRKILK